MTPVGESDDEQVVRYADRVGALLLGIADSVASCMKARGYEPDCVLATRILIPTLRECGFPATPVPTTLVVADAEATRDLRTRELKRPIRILKIGDGTGAVVDSGAWDGHLVAVARSSDNSFWLIDPTFGQVAEHPREATVAGRHVLVAQLESERPTPRADVLERSMNGGTVIYRHEPSWDWRAARGWNHPE